MIAPITGVVMPKGLGVREMAPCFGSFPFKGDERRLFVAPEDNAEVVFILFAFRNCAGHIVVQPHDDLAEANLASCVIVPVIEVALDVVWDSTFTNSSSKLAIQAFHFLVGSRNLYLLGKNNHFFNPSCTNLSRKI